MEDRPVLSEIEITPAMIEAGDFVLSGFNSEFGSYEECVVGILTAALDAAGLRWTWPQTSPAHPSH